MAKKQQRKTSKVQKPKKSSSSTTNFGEDLITEAPVYIDQTISNSLNKKEISSDAVESDILDNVSQALTSIAESVGKHSEEIFDGAIKAAGSVAGGIVDALGDIVDNIDV